MKSSGRITIRDVAKTAGVSTQTVSRVLNNRPDVSPETRTHVEQVISELEYSPNAFARGLSRGRSNTLGVVCYGLGLYGSSSVLTGIEKKANELGYALSLRLIDRIEPSNVDEIIDNLQSGRVEGLIWAVPGDVTTFEWLTEKVANIAIPVVYLNMNQINSEHIAAINNREGGRLATQHLVDQGYQHIGIITGPNQWWESKERLAGWREIVTGLHYSDIDNLIIEGDWNAASGDVGLHTLLDQSPHIDAVFVCNDQMALGALQAARRLNLEVPTDLGVVGFDDIPEAAYFFPSLTTIRQPANALGASAVDKVSALIQAQHKNKMVEPEMLLVSPRLVVRKSSNRMPKDK